MNNKILSANSIEELNKLGFSDAEIDRIFKLKKVDNVVEDIQYRLEENSDERLEIYEGEDELLNTLIRKVAWGYVFEADCADSTDYGYVIDALIDKIPRYTVSLAEWIEKHLDECDLFDDYLVGAENGSIVIRIAEGSGDNLDKEDLNNGFVDYIDYSVYKTGYQLRQDEGFDGGMILLKQHYSDLPSEEIIKMVLDDVELGPEYSLIRSERTA